MNVRKSTLLKIPLRGAIIQFIDFFVNELEGDKEKPFNYKPRNLDKISCKCYSVEVEILLSACHKCFNLLSPLARQLFIFETRKI